ncbi:MAG TPA: hypothetical protein VMU05_17995 [Dongiaceae bacterium]|nr:hypothetical protein [Dongiaceae bacterium]
MSTRIQCSVGRDGENQPCDVEIVTDLLASAGFDPKIGPARIRPDQRPYNASCTWNSVYRPDMIVKVAAQIEAFQKLKWPSNKTDKHLGTVDPDGPTFNRLTTLVNGLCLGTGDKGSATMPLASVRSYFPSRAFGYEVKSQGEIPLNGPYNVYLLLRKQPVQDVCSRAIVDGLDVTENCYNLAAGKCTSLVTCTNFIEFMKQVDDKKLWNQLCTPSDTAKAYAALVVQNAQTLEWISVSNPATFDCPVEPWHDPPIQMLGKDPSELYWNKSMFFIHKDADRKSIPRDDLKINDNLYFVFENSKKSYEQLLAIHPNERALCCLTFIGGLYHVSAFSVSTPPMGSSPDLANKLKNGAETTYAEDEAKDTKDVKEGKDAKDGKDKKPDARSQVTTFLTDSKNKNKYFMIRTPGGHCAIARNGIVFEFTTENESRGAKAHGFQQSTIEKWIGHEFYKPPFTVTPLADP